MADQNSTGNGDAKFLTFEGGEGVGKSTQVKRLLARLEQAGVTAVRTREPGGTPKAEAVRTFILEGHSESWGAGAEAVLFASARHDHVQQLIAPNIENGKWVVCDRFHDSTRAYQGLTGGVDEKLISALEQLAIGAHTPDLTIVLDMDPETAFKRVEQRALDNGTPLAGDRFEREDIQWHKRLQRAFVDIVEVNPDRCILVSADQSPEDVEADIWAAVCAKFPQLDEATA